MVSAKAKDRIIKAIKTVIKDLKFEYDVANLSDLKVHINFSKHHEPEISTMIIMSQTEKFHIENDKVIL